MRAVEPKSITEFVTARIDELHVVQEDETGYPGNWVAYAQSICVP